MARHPQIVAFCLGAITVAALVFAGFQFRAAHNHGCDRTNQILNVMHDVIEISTTPPPARQLTPRQADQLNAFRAAVYTRIDEARC